jgi:sugar lactone lactonase YvrE
LTRYGRAMAVPSVIEARVADTPAYELAEGPRWDADRGEVVWVDILSGRINTAPWTGVELGEIATVHCGQHTGAVAPLADATGWVAAAGSGFWLIGRDGSRRMLALPELAANPVTRMNDGACDPAGRFVAGSMGYGGPRGAGSLHRLDVDGTSEKLLDGLTISNGIAWSADGATMFLADSGSGRLVAYDYDADTGRPVGIARLILERDPSGEVPDGLTLDAEGCLWVAFHGGSAVRRYTPDGQLLAEVALPVSQPTSCAFIGPSLDTLLITSSYEGMSLDDRVAEPLAGRLFLCSPGVRGLPAVPSVLTF